MGMLSVKIGRFDVLSDMLRNAEDKVLDGREFSEVYGLSPVQYSRYWMFAVETGLLSGQGDEASREITEKGRKFLRDYQRIRSPPR